MLSFRGFMVRIKEPFFVVTIDFNATSHMDEENIQNIFDSKIILKKRYVSQNGLN